MINQINQESNLESEEKSSSSIVNENKSNKKSEKYQLQPYKQHIANDLFKVVGTRDLHLVICQLYELLPNNDKEDVNVIVNLNCIINSWHYSPPECWTGNKYSVWAKLCNYCSARFGTEEYLDVYNLICGIK